MLFSYSRLHVGTSRREEGKREEGGKLWLFFSFLFLTFSYDVRYCNRRWATVGRERGRRGEKGEKRGDVFSSQSILFAAHVLCSDLLPRKRGGERGVEKKKEKGRKLFFLLMPFLRGGEEGRKGGQSLQFSSRQAPGKPQSVIGPPEGGGEKKGKKKKKKTSTTSLTRCRSAAAGRSGGRRGKRKKGIFHSIPTPPCRFTVAPRREERGGIRRGGKKRGERPSLSPFLPSCASRRSGKGRGGRKRKKNPSHRAQYGRRKKEETRFHLLTF